MFKREHEALVRKLNDSFRETLVAGHLPYEEVFKTLFGKLRGSGTTFLVLACANIARKSKSGRGKSYLPLSGKYVVGVW
jgi:hypothetical protein